MPLKVNSEIGKLSSVLVHLPGPEIDHGPLVACGHLEEPAYLDLCDASANHGVHGGQCTGRRPACRGAGR